jgi:tetratricopeptide (TPR) repeat protein
MAFFWAHQYDQAIEELRKPLEMDRNFWVARLFLGRAYEQKRMYPEAIAELQNAREHSKVSSEIISMLGHVYAVSGRRSEAQQVLDELNELSKQRYVQPYHIAMVYTGLGKKDQAFGWLEKAYEDRNQFLILLNVEPNFDSLRSDPRFAQLLRRMNLAP